MAENAHANSVTPRNKRISNGPGPSPADIYPEDSPVHTRIALPPRRLPFTGINIDNSEDFPTLDEAARQPRRTARAISAAPTMSGSSAVPAGVEATQARPQQIAQRPEPQRMPTSLASFAATHQQQPPQTPYQQQQGSPFPGSGSGRNLTYDFDRLAASQQAQRQATVAQLHSVFLEPQASSQGRVASRDGPAFVSGLGSAQSTAARGSLTQPAHAPFRGSPANFPGVRLSRPNTLSATRELQGHRTPGDMSTARHGLDSSQPTAPHADRDITGRSAQGGTSTAGPGLGFTHPMALSMPRDLQARSVQGDTSTTVPSMGVSRPSTRRANRNRQGRSTPCDTSTALPSMGSSRPSIWSPSSTMRGFSTNSNLNPQSGFSFPASFPAQLNPAATLRGLGASQVTNTTSTTPGRSRRVPRPIYVVAPPQQSDALVTNPFPSQPFSGPPTNPFPSQPPSQAINPDLAAYLASAGLSNPPAAPSHQGYDNPTDYMPLIPFYPSTSSPPSPTRSPINLDPTAPFNPATDMYTTPPMSPISHRDAFLRPRVPDSMEPDARPITQGQIDGSHYGIEIGALGCSMLGTSDRNAWMGERRGRNDGARRGGWNPPAQGRRVESLAGGFRVPARRGDGWGGWEEAMRRDREGQKK